MAAFKNKDNGTWYVQFRYTDWKGERQQKLKRGFATKREALEWEREFLMEKQADVNMTFESFVALYEKDIKPKLKLNTWLTKESIIKKKILPYFANRKLSEITAKDIIRWQNEIRELRDCHGKPLSKTYLKTVHNQLSAIFNHAARFYGLNINPARQAGNMGAEERKEMLFWTREEYTRFSEAMMDKPLSFYAFEVLYWCGVREGELLALTPADFDFEKRTVTINKSYQRLNKQDVITTPKTPKSNRVIQMPQFLCDELQDYLKQLYGVEPDSRMFPISKSYLHREMDRGCKQTGVKRIRIHDLRHSQEHPDTNLIIIDTMQKIREVGGEAYSYASDYEIIGRIKQFADQHGICVLTVHHTRKQQADDSFETISGTTGLLGCADGSLLMQKKKRTELDATIKVVGRDQPDQILYLKKDPQTQIWNLERMENELYKEPPDPVLDAVAKLVSAECREWIGSPSELVEAIQTGMASNALTKYLNVKAGRLLEEYHVGYENKAKHSGRQVKLTFSKRSQNAQPQNEILCSKGAWGRCPQQADGRKCECVLTLALLARF